MSKWKEKFAHIAGEDNETWEDMEDEEKVEIAKEFFNDVGTALDSFKIKHNPDDDDKVELRGKLSDLPVKIELEIDSFAMEIYTKVESTEYFCLNWSLDKEEDDDDDDWDDDDEVIKFIDTGVYLESSDKEEIEAGTAFWKGCSDTLKDEIKGSFQKFNLEKYVVRTDEIETGYWSKEDFMETEDPLVSVLGAIETSVAIAKQNK